MASAIRCLWEIPALGAYILFFGAALAGSLRYRRRVVLAAGVLALGLTVLLFVTGLFSAFTAPDYVFFLPGSLLILLAGLLLQRAQEPFLDLDRPEDEAAALYSKRFTY